MNNEMGTANIMLKKGYISKVSFMPGLPIKIFLTNNCLTRDKIQNDRECSLVESVNHK